MRHALAKFAKSSAFYAETVPEDDYWRVKIVKGYPCEIPGKATPGENEKDLFLVVATDTLGKEQQLGKILMKGFLRP